MATGRPFRALAALAAMLLAWLLWRAPQMAQDMARIAASLAPPRVLPAAAAPMPAALLQHRNVPSPPPLLRRAASRPAFTPVLPMAERAGAAITMAPSHLLPPLIEPPAAAPPPAPPSPAPIPQSPAFSLAARAYDRLGAGQRRQAAALFDAALALDPGSRQWQADRRALSRRWQVGGFALVRDGGRRPNQPGSGLPGAAASPVLGGGQLGGSIAFLPDPYARSPLAIVVRVNMAADPAGLRPQTAGAAIGLRQTLLPGVTLSAERLIPLGDAARGNWTLRLAAGARSGRLEAYGEAGVLGSGDAYAGGQAHARILRIGPATLHAATWASVQTGTPDAWRVDAGPSVSATYRGLRLTADWRHRIAGNAAPGSGPALTVSAGF